MSERRQFIINIDGRECLANEGETILNVARNNGINIPTLCDLKKLSPTGACRMCVVEQNGNIIASCKSYVSGEISVKTNTERLQKYRNQIMSFLCINHPLECGVCDKSGECELQDKVLESKVDIQPFFALQKKNDFVHFTNKIYDESLCIVCERCARTCNEYVGNNVLSVLSGGFSSKIGVNFDAYCEDCDECVSVCPTGAMISNRFIYTSNAWELEKVPSHCLHCSMRCDLYYEIKHNIDSKKEVYRIKNDAHIKQLCHAGRHFFMRTNEAATFTDYEVDIEDILSNVDSVRLSVECSNEEALIANMLAKHAAKKLFCDDALLFKEFEDIVKGVSGFYCGVNFNKDSMSQMSFDSKENVMLSGSETSLESMQKENQNLDSKDSSPTAQNDGVIRAQNDLAQTQNVIAIHSHNDVAEIHDDSVVMSQNNLVKQNPHFKPTDKNIRTLLDNAKVVINLGCYMFDEIPILRSDLSKLAIKKGVKNIWINAIAESRFQSDLEIVYDVYSEPQVSIVLLKLLCDFIDTEGINVPFDMCLVRDYLSSIDLGDAIALSNISDYEMERLGELMFRRHSIITPHHEEIITQDRVVILVGMDFYKSPHASVIANILGMFDCMDFIDVAVIPYGNAKGIANICDLTKDNASYQGTLGIRTLGEYSISPFPKFMKVLDSKMMRDSSLNAQNDVVIHSRNDGAKPQNDSWVKIQNNGVVISRNDNTHDSQKDVDSSAKTQNDKLAMNDTSAVMLSGSETSMQNQDFKDSSPTAQNDNVIHVRNDLAVKIRNDIAIRVQNDLAHTQNDNAINSRNDGVAQSRNNGVIKNQNDKSEIKNHVANTTKNDLVSKNHPSKQNTSSNKYTHTTQSDNKHIPTLPLQFMEGTFVDINNHLVKIAPAFINDDYTLSKEGDDGLLDLLDICRDYLDLDSDYIIELCEELPFNNIAFDSLSSRSKAYLENAEPKPLALDSISVSENQSGAFIYHAGLSGNLSMPNNELRVSRQFLSAMRLREEEQILLELGNVVLSVRVCLMPTLSGMVGILSSDEILDSRKYFDFKRV